MTLIKKLFGPNSISEEIKDIEVDKKKNLYGRISYLNRDKGYGFITTKGIPFERIFFHWSALKQSTLSFLDVKRGMYVTFDAIKQDTKWKAVAISIVDKREELVDE